MPVQPYAALDSSQDPVQHSWESGDGWYKEQMFVQIKAKLLRFGLEHILFTSGVVMVTQWCKIRGDIEDWN